MKRLLISTSFTVVVVTAIFLLMTQLIQKDASVLKVTDMPTLVTRLIKEVPETKKIRRIPPKKKIVKKQPEQLHDKPETVTETKLTQAVDISFKNAWVTNSTSFYNQAGNADEVLTPVVTIEPGYPISAIRDNREGWVTLGFTVTKFGSVADVKVLDSRPKRVFEKVALKALYKWKYRPEIVDGHAVDSPDQIVTLEFNLDDS